MMRNAAPTEPMLMPILAPVLSPLSVADEVGVGLVDVDVGIWVVLAVVGVVVVTAIVPGGLDVAVGLTMSTSCQPSISCWIFASVPSPRTEFHKNY